MKGICILIGTNLDCVKKYENPLLNHHQFTKNITNIISFHFVAKNDLVFYLKKNYNNIIYN